MLHSDLSTWEAPGLIRTCWCSLCCPCSLLFKAMLLFLAPKRRQGQSSPTKTSLHQQKHMDTWLHSTELIASMSISLLTVPNANSLLFKPKIMVVNLRSMEVKQFNFQLIYYLRSLLLQLALLSWLYHL